MNIVPSAYNAAVNVLAAEGGPTPDTGLRGPEFGKAAPVGLLVILALLVVVLFIGFAMNKRIRRLERRRAFADMHGIDLFDTQRLEAAMRAEGFSDVAPRGSMFARTEVPVTDDRFLPSSGIKTGADAIDAERAQEAQRRVEGLSATGGKESAGRTGSVGDPGAAPGHKPLGEQEAPSEGSGNPRTDN
ncbi:hypothetical protein [Corynebacterium heidelbergense]|uniref:hypothetical protein n=1 Tax=Corynebacterium heidelbergense TaxID=2055947 RepID=UPI001EE75040|nr:hypothetical protein [Corynebacterium heidelbergense]WCZ37067.1 hypothetical protein CHEID_07670 [Corynebacterium heidelbergense]